MPPRAPDPVQSTQSRPTVLRPDRARSQATVFSSGDPHLLLHLLQGDSLGFGISEQHHEELQHHHAAKNANGAAPDLAASEGNVPDIAAAITQCVKLPRLCPLARTRLGNTSLR